MALLRDRQMAALRDALAQVADHVEDEVGPSLLAEMVGPQAFRATLGGRGCRVASVRVGRNSTLIGVRVIAPTADAPFELNVTGKRMWMSALPSVPIGDPAFESELRIGATLPELAPILLDADTRRRLHATFASMSRLSRSGLRFLEVSKGHVEWFVPVRKVSGGLLFPGEPPAPADLRDAIACTFALADRVGPAFERARAEVARRGPQADAAWIQGQHAALAIAQQNKKREMRLVIGAVLACSLVPLVLIIVLGAVAVIVFTSTARR